MPLNVKKITTRYSEAVNQIGSTSKRHIFNPRKDTGRDALSGQGKNYIHLGDLESV